jgi:hypothetical protein
MGHHHGALVFLFVAVVTLLPFGIAHWVEMFYMPDSYAEVSKLDQAHPCWPYYVEHHNKDIDEMIFGRPGYMVLSRQEAVKADLAAESSETEPAITQTPPECFFWMPHPHPFEAELELFFPFVGCPWLMFMPFVSFAVAQKLLAHIEQ